MFFNDHKMFKPGKIWRVSEIITRFKKTEITMFGVIVVKANNGKDLQHGLIIDAQNEVDAIDKYEIIKKALND